MSIIKFADKTRAEAEIRKVPSQFAALFAKAGLEPPMEGQKLSLASVDAAIRDLTIDERMIIKTELRRACHI